MKTKTIILSNPTDNTKTNGRGILSFYIEDEILICKLRLYNISPLDRHAKLAIYHQNEVYSANLLERSGCYETSLVGNFDIDTDFYSAVIDTTNNNNIVIAGGTYSGYFFEDLIQTQNTDQTIKSSTITNNEPNKCESCTDCSNCKYKKFFYDYHNETKDITLSKSCDTQTTNAESKTIKQTIDQNIPNGLIENIIPQFDFIFEKYPQNEELINLIENSKFVEIKENNQSFSIGAIYNNDNIKYICYAVKSSYNNPAPTELGDHYQWVPTDAEDPLSDGYYIVFQDATDLKIVEL